MRGGLDSVMPNGGSKRIIFTGGSGKAGRHVIPELLKKGHKVGRQHLDSLNS